MAQSLVRVLILIAFGSFGIIALLASAAPGTLAISVAVIAAIACYFALKHVVPFIDDSALAQGKFLDFA